MLWGEHDQHFAPVHARRLHATIPGARLDIVLGGEHWMGWYRAAEVADRVAAFASDARKA